MPQPVEIQKTDGDALFCDRCGHAMALTVIAPSPVRDHDSITYACTNCGNTLVKDVPYR